MKKRLQEADFAKFFQKTIYALNNASSDQKLSKQFADLYKKNNIPYSSYTD